jgi:CSLREA domain-containing protein
VGHILRRTPVALAAVIVILTSGLTASAALSADEVSIDVPGAASSGRATAITLRLPRHVAAVDGRVLLAEGAGELLGVAPFGRGQALAPAEVDGGYAFGAYALKPKGDHTALRLVVVPHAEGNIELRVAIDSVADASGSRLALAADEVIAELPVNSGKRTLTAPRGALRPAPQRAAKPTRDLFGRGVISPEDLDIIRAAWYRARESDSVCQADAIADDDANGDGCVDIVDVQALLAGQGDVTGGVATARPVTAARSVDTRFTASIDWPPPPATATLEAPIIFVVNSTADTTDANPGNGVCADTQGRCTLRAAITESNWQSGEKAIHFNLAGTAPVRIQLTSALPTVGTSSNSGVTIDGYTQPGSQPNTAIFGSNAIPGVEVRGTGTSLSYIFYTARAGSVFRGMLLSNSYRGVFMDGPAATNNRVVGNFIGFNPDNSLPPRGRAGVLMQIGAHHNVVGTSNLADRNVIGNFDKGIYQYGAGTDGNVIQNNVLCIRPNGESALCQIAMDHDFGPKASLIGGSAPNERNVSGTSTLNGYEFSHGWDPNGPPNQTTTTWQISDHVVIGNWIGFRADGRYDPAYRAAQNAPTFDNGQGINVFDGARNNLFESNYIASVYDGGTIGLSNSSGNVFRNNIFGESPLGEPAPMAGWGFYLYSNTRNHLIEGNVFRNATKGGVALLESSVQQIRISRNIITGTNGPAIYLTPDSGNPSTGANGLLSPPTFGTSTETQASGTGIAGATVELFKASRGFGQQGLPIQFLGSAVVAGNGTWTVPYAVALQTGDRVTALQIRTNGDTSTLANNVWAGGPPPAPVANFSSSQQPVSLTVNFTDTSTGSPTSWNWSFGDGTSSTQQNPVKTYGVGGTYTVSLTATNATASNSVSKTVNVAALPPGTVLASDSFSRSFNDSWGSADVGGGYTIENTTGNYSVAGGVGVMVVPSPGHTRAAVLGGVAGRDVDLRFRVATDKRPSGGLLYTYAEARRSGNNTYRAIVMINASGSVLLQASTIVNNSETGVSSAVAVPGLTYNAGTFIRVRAQATSANPTTIRIKAWIDGQAEPSTWHYTATNSTAALQTTGAVGLRTYISSGLTNAPVTFRFDDFLVTTPGDPAPPPPAPVADFGFSQQAGTLTMNFSDASTGSPTSWSWNFGDGSSSTQQNPTKTYAVAGSYSVSLTASNAGGSNMVTKTVQVSSLPPPPPPVANFSFNQQSGTLNVSFSDTSTGSPTSWSWSFGDGTTSTQQNPTKNYAAGDSYSVSLTASNAGGSNLVTKTVEVEQPAFVIHAADTFGRTSNNSWGSADTGGSYTLQGAASAFSVADGAGVIVLPSGGANRAALLGDVNVRDVDLLFRAATDKRPTGGQLYAYGVIRRNGNNAYRTILTMNANGSVSVQASTVINNGESGIGSAVTVPGLTHSANSFIWLRAEVTGASPTTIRLRAWADGQTEPSTWHYTATNTTAALQSEGNVGLRAYISSALTNAPVTFRFDDFLVRAP